MIIGPDIIRDGLVLLLDASSQRSYPGSGDIWYDLNGYNNNVILYNSPTFNTKSFIFDGISDYGIITNNSKLDFSKGQTLMICMKHTFTVGRRNPWDQAYGGYGTWTHESGNNITHYFGDSGTNGTPYIAMSSETTPRGVWNIMTNTRGLLNNKWYFNNNLTRITNHIYSDLTYTAADIRIGRGYAGYWEGEIGLIYAYNRQLTDNEVFHNFNATKRRFEL